MAQRNIALFGDSVLNNIAVVNKDSNNNNRDESKAVIGKLKNKFSVLATGQDVDVLMYAFPGSTMIDLKTKQMDKMTVALTDVCISIGGNDVISKVANYRTNRQSISTFFDLLGWIFIGFQIDYKIMIGEIKSKLHPDCKIMVCNLYKPSHSYGFLKNIVYGISRWWLNWCISDVAMKESLILLDLNQNLKLGDIDGIEPNEKASEKIANLIFNSVQNQEKLNFKCTIDHES